MTVEAAVGVLKNGTGGVKYLPLSGWFREALEVVLDAAGASQKAAPGLTGLLGVEEDEEWRYPECAGLYRVHNGVREYWDENNGWLYCDCEEDLVKIIAHPESIIRLPRLTEPEIAIMRAVGAKYVSSLDHEVVALWGDKPTFDADIKDGWDYTFSFKAEHLIAGVSASLFPSMKPGDCIGLEEVEDGAEVD